MKRAIQQLGCSVALTFPLLVQAQPWQPVTDEAALRAIMTGTVLSGQLVEGVRSRSTFNADGTGELRAWNGRFPRSWTVENQQVCVVIDDRSQCFRIEQDEADPATYRAVHAVTGVATPFTVSDQEAVIEGTAASSSSGGAAEPSAEEVAKSLANPNTPLASQTFKFQYRLFEGELPDADDQSGTTVLYQPSFPFKLDNGATLFFRPAFPIVMDQPVYNGADNDFDSVSGMGDIGFDLAYGRTTSTGVLWAVGVISTLPTATKDELGPDRWNLGPEFLIGKISKKYVLGALTTYQTDVGGSGDADISLTTVNAFATFLPGGGWNVGSAPIMSYDHENSQWTLPLNLSFGKTVIWKGRPWKLGAEINYFVDQPDAFGPRWMFGINIAPVVENVFARMFQ